MGKKVLTYCLTLESPVVLSVPGGDPNSAETLTYISGSSVAGALAARWQAIAPKNLAVGDIFRRLFLDGSIRYLNAYPEGEENRRLLPPPLSICVRKEEGDKIYDLAEPDEYDLLDKEDRQKMTYQYLSWNEGFIRLTDHALKFRPVGRTSGIHHERDRELGRATADQGAIFSYVSLNPGERFVGHILMEDDEPGELLTSLLHGGPLFLGRSRAAQYGGHARVSSISLSEGDGFCEAGKTTFTGNRLVVTLLSDYLGMSDSGHPTPEAFLPELSKRLCFPVDKVSVEKCFLGVRPVSGYVNKWRMPRPVVPALQQGSVFVLGLQDSPTADKIKRVLWEGLGMRRIEGFGRLALNWHGLENKDETYTERAAGIEILRTVSTVSQTFPGLDDLFHLSRKRLLEQDLDVRIVQAASTALYTSSNPPSRAFLGRLRNLVRNAAASVDITDFIAECGGSMKPAGKHLDRCRIKDTLTLGQWLTEVFTSPNKVIMDMGYAHTTSLTALANDKLQSWSDHSVLDENSMLWAYQKRYADLVLQGLSKGREE